MDDHSIATDEIQLSGIENQIIELVLQTSRPEVATAMGNLVTKLIQQRNRAIAELSVTVDAADLYSQRLEKANAVISQLYAELKSK